MAPTLPSHGHPETYISLSPWGWLHFDAIGAPNRVITRYGFSHPNPLLNAPQPNLIYTVRPNTDQWARGVRFTHTFRTTHDSSTDLARVHNLAIYRGRLAGKRWPSSLCAPVNYRGGSYDRGHLIAAHFGAGMERINLVSMPSSTNRSHTAATAQRLGHFVLARLKELFEDRDHYAKGTLTQSGEFALPSYRLFEIKVANCIKGSTDKIWVSIQPSTVQGVTDIIYAHIGCGSGPAFLKYKIDCDV